MSGDCLTGNYHISGADIYRYNERNCVANHFMLAGTRQNLASIFHYPAYIVFRKPAKMLSFVIFLDHVGLKQKKKDISLTTIPKVLDCKFCSISKSHIIFISYSHQDWWIDELIDKEEEVCPYLSSSSSVNWILRDKKKFFSRKPENQKKNRK